MQLTFPFTFYRVILDRIECRNKSIQTNQSTILGLEKRIKLTVAALGTLNSSLVPAIKIRAVPSYETASQPWRGQWILDTDKRGKHNRTERKHVEILPR